MNLYVGDDEVFSLSKALGIKAYPATMCESCITSIDDLVTSGEWSAAREELEDLTDNPCADCLQLKECK